MTIRSGDFSSYNYLYNQQLDTINASKSPRFTTRMSRLQNGLPETRFCCSLLAVTAAD